MQKDCHYYGTYFIAMKAGFKQEDAEKIAWASQTVDKMTHDVVRAKRDEEINLQIGRDKAIDIDTLKKTYTEKYYNVVTVHDFVFYLYQKEVTRQDTLPQLSKQIESVWSVFHFLPSNSTENLNTKDRSAELKNFEDYDFAKKKYTRDLKLVCKPSSKLANQIFEYVLSIAKNTSQAEYSEEFLYTIGILMHVIADTWSHQDFCGSNDMLVNRGFIIENDNKFLYKPNWGEIFLGKIAWIYSKSFEELDIDSVLRSFSAIWTGHGSSGTYPDIPGKNYTYIPDYTNQPISVENPVRFRKAFTQMYYIMVALREKKEYTITSSIKILDFVDEAGNKCFTDDEDESARCQKWNSFLGKKLKEYEEVDKKNNHKTFLDCAHKYRNFVLDKIAKDIINDDSYYKDVEQLTIKELDSSKFEDAINAFKSIKDFASDKIITPIQQSTEEKINNLNNKWNKSWLQFMDGIFANWDLWDLVRR